jgi:hypothetical protein
MSPAPMAGGIIKSVLESANATGDPGASRFLRGSKAAAVIDWGTQTADTQQGQLHGRTE